MARYFPFQAQIRPEDEAYVLSIRKHFSVSKAEIVRAGITKILESSKNSRPYRHDIVIMEAHDNTKRLLEN